MVHWREHKSFKTNGIKHLMKKNYSVSTDKLDVEAEVDNKLGMAENWSRLKDRIVSMSPKKEALTARDEVKRWKRR